MKITTTILLSFIANQFVFGQIDTRLLRHSNSDFSICTSICHLNQALYLNLGANSNFSEWTSEQWIYKLDYSLNTLDSVKLNDFISLFSGDLLRLVEIEPHNGKLYTVVNIQNGSSSLNTGNQYRTILIRMDANLNLIDFKQLGNDSTATNYGQIGFSSNQKIILGGAEYKAGEFWKPSVIKLDQKLAVNKLVIYDSLPESNAAAPFFIDHLAVIDDQILCYTLPIANLQRKAILCLDTSLIFKGYGSVNSNINGGQSALARGLRFTGMDRDSLYAFGALNWLDNTQHQRYALGISKLDTNYNTSIADTIPLTGRVDQQNPTKPFLYFDPGSFKSPDSLFIAVNDQYLSDSDFNLKDSNTFFLYNYNLRKNSLNWRKEIKTGLTNAWHSVEAIPGNRYLLAFSQYDWITNSSPDLEVHLWLIDENGAILNRVELHKPMSLATAYPNPCYNEIDIPKELTQDRGLNYLIINQQGLEVQNGSLKKGSTKIDVSRLPQACYYLLTEHGNVKIIKK